MRFQISFVGGIWNSDINWKMAWKVFALCYNYFCFLDKLLWRYCHLLPLFLCTVCFLPIWQLIDLFCNDGHHWILKYLSMAAASMSECFHSILRFMECVKIQIKPATHRAVALPAILRWAALRNKKYNFEQWNFTKLNCATVYHFPIIFAKGTLYVFIWPRYTWGPIYGSGCLSVSQSVTHLLQT